MIGDALIFLAAIAGFAVFGLYLGGLIGRSLGVQKAEQGGIELVPGSVWNRYRQLLQMAAAPSFEVPKEVEGLEQVIIRENDRMLAVLHYMMAEAVVQPLEEQQELIGKRLDRVRHMTAQLVQDPLFVETPSEEEADFGFFRSGSPFRDLHLRRAASR
jgi:hypothetical protein